jgi:hypothetical protein
MCISDFPSSSIGLFTKQVHEQIYKTRKKLFVQKNNMDWIPPTKAVMEEHVKRAACQGGHVQGQIFALGTRAVTGNQLGLDQKSGGIV